MARKLIRHYGRGHLDFITFTCYRRFPLLRSVRARNAFVQILRESRDRYGFSLAGDVVMPNHIHLLIGEPSKGNPSTVMQILKQRVSRRLRRKPRRKSVSRQLALLFLQMNPVKRKVVTHPKDWPWSSFSYYSKKEPALLSMDSAH